MYKYLNKRESKFIRSLISKIIQKVQHHTQNDLTFTYSFFYGGGSSLIFRDRFTGLVDCEYAIVIKEATQPLWNDLCLIKEKLRESFNRAQRGVTFFESSDKSFILEAQINNRRGKRYTNFKIAILLESEEGFEQIYYNRFSNHYESILIEGTKDLDKKIKKVKEMKKWDYLREVLLQKRQNIITGSFYSVSELFLEVLNEIYNEIIGFNQNNSIEEAIVI